MSTTLQGTLRLYGCGGFGVNIASSFDKAAAQHELGYAETHPVYIDTSRSNLRQDIVPEHVFLLEEVDGSGKVRRENHQEISRTVKSIVQQYEPKDLNVVVFSASGGSGSVFGPLIMGELLERGETVLGIVVGSDESSITARNTLNTLKSLESIAAKQQAPVVIYYEQNERDVKRSDIDKACRRVIGSLAILASRQNAEMDTRDIANWVRFNRSTSVGPRLALFDVYNSNTEAEAANQPISIASLYPNPDVELLAIEPEYHAAGYPSSNVANFETMHFVITTGGIPVISKRMEQKIADQEQRRASRVVHNTIVGDNDVVADDGMIL